MISVGKQARNADDELLAQVSGGHRAGTVELELELMASDPRVRSENGSKLGRLARALGTGLFDEKGSSSRHSFSTVDGGEHKVGRRTSESFTVRGARLVTGLQVQEEALRSFFEKNGSLARGMGYFARFLFAWRWRVAFVMVHP